MQISVVMKFGGSSLASAERIREVAEIICSFPEHYPCIVLSAMGKVSTTVVPSRNPTRRQMIRGPVANYIMVAFSPSAACSSMLHGDVVGWSHITAATHTCTGSSAALSF